MAWYSQTWTWVDGEWLEGNPGLMGPRTHAAWLGSSVFDGARVFEGVMPDMDRHAERVNRSAVTLGLKPTMAAEEIVELDARGRRRNSARAPRSTSSRCTGPRPTGLDRHARSRIRRASACACSRRRCRVPGRLLGHAVAASAVRRSRRMPTDAKAGCLYPNNARALREAKAEGFDNALVLRHARQRRRDRDLEHLPRQGRRREDAGRRTAPSSTASPASA